MNPAKQFWPVLKFQLVGNPIVFVPAIIAFGTPIFISLAFRPPLEFSLLATNIFMIGFLGVLMLSSDWFPPGHPMKAGQEYLLSKPVDRYLLARSRAAIFYLVTMIVPVAEVIISIFLGRPLIAAWHVDTFLLATAMVQVLVYALKPVTFTYRRYVFWALLALFLAIGVAIWPPAVFHSHSLVGSFAKRAFLFFAAHQLSCWCLTIAAVVLSQLWCERSFARREA
jgi:hypothetical protein